MKAVPLGDATWRFDRPEHADARALFETLKAAPDVIDVVVTEAHVAVSFDPSRPPTSVEALLDGTFPRGTAATTTHVVGVRYDGEDLAAVAARHDVDVDTVVRWHAAHTYDVHMIGFMPGFAYLGDLDERVFMPRRATPRVRVPPHAVAIGGKYTAVYPFASPGGWHLLGTAIDFVPFRFALGDRVRFEPR